MSHTVWERRGVARLGVSLVLPGMLLAGGLVALSCGSLDSPTEPAPDTHSPDASGNPGSFVGGPGPAATPTPSPSPSGGPSPSPTADPAGQDCGDPLPPEISRINVNVHLRGPSAWTLDSTPLVGPDVEYCRKIGFTDGRSFCAVRPEGNPQRAACEALAVGRAKDTNRPGPTWYFGGNFCTGQPSGCQNHPENQYLLLIYTGGTFQACAQNGVCGEVTADR